MTSPSICPDCGRLKAANADDLRQRGCCPKWYAIRDQSATRGGKGLVGS